MPFLKEGGHFDLVLCFVLLRLPGAKSSSRLGRKNKAINMERDIIIAVSTPKVENAGIGAKAMTAKPTMVVMAVQLRAKPVVRPVL